MGQVEKKIAEDIRDIVDPERGKRFVVYSGTVIAGSVDESAGTCKVVLSKDDDASPTGGIMINAVVNNANGFILYPADNSNVWVTEIDGPDKYGIIKCSNITKAVIMFDATAGGDRCLLMTNDFFEARIGNYWSHVENGKTELKAGHSSLTGTDSLFKFNDGSFGGIPKPGVLASKFNAIENRLNNLFTTITGGIATGAYAGATGGAALAAVIVAQLAGVILPLTTQTAIENADVKHGPHT